MTQNMETLKLYKNTKLYNGSRYKFYQGSRNYDDWLASNSTEIYNKQVYFKSLSEPIVINEFIKNCDEYTYGSITNEGKTYYIFIDSISTDAYKQTTIKYSIDWWSTNWNNVTCTKAHIIRSSDKPMYMQQPFSPMNVEFSLKEGIGGKGGCIVFSYLSSLTDDKLKFGAIDINEINGMEFVEIGDWVNSLSDSSDHRLTAQDINAIFIVPIFTIDDFINAGWNKVTAQGLYWYCSESTGSSKAPSKTINFSTLETDEKEVNGIIDWNGNTIWECPYGVEISNFTVDLSLSIQQAQLRFKYENSYGNEITGKGFTYECRKCAIIVNQEVEYTWRERESEYNTRRLQSMKQVWTNASDAVQGIGFGYAFGQKSGAKAAAAGGLLNTFSTWAMNQVFDPQFQAMQDLKYERMQDLVSVYGESVTSLYKLKVGNNNIYILLCNGRVENDYENLTTNYNLLLNTISEEFTNEIFIENDRLVVVDSKCLIDGEYQVFKKKFFDDNDSAYPIRNTIYQYDGSNWNVINTTFSIYTVPYNPLTQNYTQGYVSKVGVAPVVNNIGLFLRAHTSTSNYSANDYDVTPELRIFTGTNWVQVGTYVSYPHKVVPYNYTQEELANVQFICSTNGSISEGQTYSYLMYSYKLTMDSATQTRMDKDIETNGYYCDETTDKLYLRFSRVSKIQATDVTVEGACTLEGKQQIVYRLASGVEFI